ncbi:Pro-neuregulin-3, membrane-bound isoform [Anas platyrhynchos]|uniref:Pro-neuregulin-3, membrane-bound isoform n=1 Tax=Anas platyrhynchos TaxID=8839 RepID=R0JH35_ANAPL|nr:Pro-neuregulin-3, membrane-bound isoform [Anas platyrhynchos]
MYSKLMVNRLKCNALFGIMLWGEEEGPYRRDTTTYSTERSEHFKPCKDKDLAYCLNEGECFVIETLTGSHKHCRHKKSKAALPVKSVIAAEEQGYGSRVTIWRSALRTSLMQKT